MINDEMAKLHKHQARAPMIKGLQIPLPLPTWTFLFFGFHLYVFSSDGAGEILLK